MYLLELEQRLVRFFCFSVSVFSSCPKFNLCNSEMENEMCCTYMGRYGLLGSYTNCKGAIYVTVMDFNSTTNQILKCRAGSRNTNVHYLTFHA